MIKIYLDDERDIPEGFVWCRNAKEFFDIVVNNINNIEHIMFDHDLWVVEYWDINADMISDELNWIFRKWTILEKSWYFCAKRFIETYTLLRLDMPLMTCHSANPVGKKRIVALIDETISRYNKKSFD